ncbi:Nitroreductase-like protein [Mycena maculata]|uniref:Nitroreductase-like protein n=1 Tax=Mycena maculata TaxID=230809 RepID=A0AAD7MHP1_9AGAR|nr:Nitroreductase-like protein [Mycena maculata]
MSGAYLSALAVRRTNRTITPKSSIPDEKLEAIVKACVLHSPTPFNIQSSRAVLVTGAANARLWKLVADSLETAFEGDMRTTALARVAAYSAGYGSVLFFEDQKVIDEITEKMPFFTKHFPVWSTNATGMLQHAVWTAFSLEGLGASLQHNGAYSDELVAEILKTFSLPSTWTSTAIMPFGDPAAPPTEKDFGAIEDRVKIFKA